MSEQHQGKGHCLCGAIGISVKTMSKNIGGCHCQMCRKWGGGPLLVVDCGSDVLFEGQENITTFNSSEWAERGFCKQCGTHLFYPSFVTLGRGKVEIRMSQENKN